MQNASISTSARPTQEKQNLRSSYICVCVSVPVRTCATQVQTHANVSCEKMFLLMLASCMSSPVLRLRVRGPGLKTNYSNEAQRFQQSMVMQRILKTYADQVVAKGGSFYLVYFLLLKSHPQKQDYGPRLRVFLALHPQIHTLDCREQ